MYDIRETRKLVREARQRYGLTQRELAERASTSQPAIASLERGDSNPTVDTLSRIAAACGFVLRLSLEPLPVADPVVDRYKQDVDRTLLRENLRRSVDERLRSLSEWQRAGEALERATALAKSAMRATTRAR